MKMRSRWGSPVMMDQALAAPVVGSVALALGFFPSEPADAVVGIGSQLQRNRPLRASKARTTPAGMAVPWLSVMAQPTTTRTAMAAAGWTTWVNPLQLN